MAHFGMVEYWNTRYNATREVEPFHEWYQNYASLRHLLSNECLSPALTATKPSSHAPYMAPPTMAAAVSQQAPSDFPNRKSCRTLILGCGNSRFGEDMLRDGWTGGIVNVDFSPVVIGQMKAKYNDAFYENLGLNKSCMEFVCADITKGLGCFQDGSFDLIICKATFDAVLSSAGSIANGKQVIRDCNRLLADNHGVFMLVTFGNPDSRVEFLEHQGDLSYYWQGVSVHTVTRSSKELPAKKDYVYICRKRASDQDFNATSSPNETKTNEEENQPASASDKLSYSNSRPPL